MNYYGTTLRIWVVSFFALAFFLSTARGTEWVVDQRHPKASDDNPGTANRPFRTISAAAERVRAGDKVMIHGGDYRETVIIKTSGTPEAPIIFEAAPGETPVIKGSEIVKGWTRTSANVWKAKLPTLPPRSNDKGNPYFWETNAVRQVFIKDGVLLDASHLRPAQPDNLREGNFFCDKAKNDLYVWLPESQDANRTAIEASMRTTWLSVLGSNIIIRGIQMRHSSTLSIGNGPACSIPGANVSLENCTMTWADFVGISVSGTNDKLINCLIACNGCAGMGGTGQNHLIEGCRFLYNNIDRYYYDWHAGGAKLIPSFEHSHITRNEFAYNMGHALWLDGGCNDNLVDRNLCHDNEGAGIVIEVSARNRVFNNICFGNRNPLTADFLEPAGTTANGRPVFEKKQHGGEPLTGMLYHAGDARGIYISSSPETKMFHNTCYLNEGEGICVEGSLRREAGGNMSTRDCLVLNNICAYNKGAQLVLRRNGADGNTSGNRSDYNLLARRGAVLAEAGWGVSIAMLLKDWQKSSGNDIHSIQADPAFAMAAMEDFRLLPISPAAAAAPPLPEVQTDFYRISRPKDQVSIGACEITAQDYPRPARLGLFGANSDRPVSSIGTPGHR